MSPFSLLLPDGRRVPCERDASDIRGAVSECREVNVSRARDGGRPAVLLHRAAGTVSTSSSTA